MYLQQYQANAYACFRKTYGFKRRKPAINDLFMAFKKLLEHKSRFLGYTLNSEEIGLWKVLGKYKVQTSKDLK